MGCELVEGRDLAVDTDDCVYMQTVGGWSRVDVIYRRIDDDFLDQEVFREDSSLGVPGLMRAWKKGNVALANAPGAGRGGRQACLYLRARHDPLLPLGRADPRERALVALCEPQQLEHVLAHLEELVVKPVDGSGGYGMLMGPASTKVERAQFARALKADPRSFVAQPVITLSTVPTLVDRASSRGMSTCVRSSSAGRRPA